MPVQNNGPIVKKTFNTNSGNVGIGTAAPGAALSVAGNRAIVGSPNLVGSYGSNDTALELQGGSGAAILGVTQGNGVGAYLNLSVYAGNATVALNRVGGAAYGDLITYTGG